MIAWLKILCTQASKFDVMLSSLVDGIISTCLCFINHFHTADSSTNVRYSVQADCILEQECTTHDVIITQ